MANIDWGKLGFDAYRTKTLVLARWTKGKWSEITESDEFHKVAANYAATFRPYQIAHDQGHMELLYLNASTHEYIDEFGSSNFFGIKNNTYVTPLSDSVLPSITNKCLQEIAVDLGLKVEKRPVRLEELEEFEEVGGCGTAVVINPMSHIEVKEVLEEEPVKKVYRFCPDGEVGPVSTRL